jgi:hypothetical protein
MNDELRERAKVWLSKQGKVRILDYTFTSHLMADFAAEAVRAERERFFFVINNYHAAECRLVRDGECHIWDALDELREAK